MGSKVAIEKVKSDDFEGINEALIKAIENIGGIEDIIKPGFKVLIKPNMVAVPKTRLSGAVTRVELAEAVCGLVQRLGATPFIAESASVGADTEDVILFCGYDRLREKGIEIIDLKRLDTVAVPLDGRLLKSIPTWQIVEDADAIITLPVMKNHDQLEITLGLKNLKGLVSDGEKKFFHANGVTDGVLDLAEHFKPVLEIIDGTYCQEGMGPVFGETVRMDLIIASKDLVACEACAGLIMGYAPEEVPITKAAAERGLGSLDFETAGSIDSVKRRFKRASETEIKGLPQSFRLIVDDSACTGCRNTVVEQLMYVRDEGHLSDLEGKTFIVGPVKDLPAGCNAENTRCYGSCAVKSLGLKFGLPGIPGCPPYI